jgi:MFS transporter, PAT family, solute carrier family 33 (acetyl-CoA transportor), member 1
MHETNCEIIELKSSLITEKTEVKTETTESNKPNAKEDIFNILFILLLYVFQAIPLGLLSSIPMILQSRKVSYLDQGLISFAFWPLSLKLLWAPLIDTIYLKKIGRRKTWVFILEILMGIIALSTASYLNKILDIETVRSRKGKIKPIF